jgi:hypothetical protein
MAREPSPNDTLSKRIAHFRKAFAKGLGRRPSALQNAAMLRAARLTALAEAAALDPTTTANDLVRLDGAARRARLDMKATLVAKREQLGPTLAEYIASKRGSSGASR